MMRRPPRFPPSSALAAGLQQPAPARLLVALAVCVLLGTAVLGGIAAHVIGQRLEARNARETELLRELERREIARHTLEAALAEMRRSLDERDRRLAAVERAHAELDRSLQQVDAERAALEDERNLARQRARLLDRGARETERWLETAQRERLAMERERAALEARLIEVDEARALAERREQGLRWRLETTAAQLARLEADRDATTRWLADWIGERLGAIETVLQHTGLEPGRLLARAADGTGTSTEAGLGGPLLPFVEPASAPAILGLGTPLVHDLALDIDRLEAAERLLTSVPLAAPFDHYHQTSRFGPRTDPITRRRALHNGLDFGAATGSEVMATAPGRVTHAGRMGSYGIMVEIDHGHGITTRYAHLSRTMVQPGDHVSLRTPVGIIGNTGRSTGRHLHYEVRLDNAPKDPARFIAAGRRLISALGS
jgi:murein DD-endopeptidase MepM/ murein hydrolase activator NlpD